MKHPYDIWVESRAEYQPCDRCGTEHHFEQLQVVDPEEAELVYCEWCVLDRNELFALYEDML